MADLDDPQLYRQCDPTGLGERIASLPSQCRDAWVKALAFPLPEDYRRVERVLVLGMGGSAIGGDLLSGLQAFQGGLPVQVHRDYGLSGPADDGTLVVASSYSGNTEETLHAFDKAWRPGVKAVACTTGGSLASLCRMKGIPLFPIEFEGESRSAVGYGLFGLLGFLQRLGLASDRSQAVAEAIAQMEALSKEIGSEAPTSRNPAKQMAAAAHGKIVVVYGAQHLSAAARRWKTQIAENAKTWAFFELLPELNHNSIEGVQFPLETAKNLFIVILRSELYNPRVTLRCDLTGEILAEAGIQHASVEARGDGPLAQIMTAVLFGDYVSYYLAVKNGIDPSVTPNLSNLKQRLASGQG